MFRFKHSRNDYGENEVRDGVVEGEDGEELVEEEAHEEADAVAGRDVEEVVKAKVNSPFKTIDKY